MSDRGVVEGTAAGERDEPATTNAWEGVTSTAAGEKQGFVLNRRMALALVADREALQGRIYVLESSFPENFLAALEDSERRVGVLEAALRQAAMNLATARDTRWMPFNGEMPDLSLGEIADAWYALLVEQASGAVLAGGEAGGQGQHLPSDTRPR